MGEWMDGGARLGWGIDPRNRRVYLFRAGQVEPNCSKTQKLCPVKTFCRDSRSRCATSFSIATSRSRKHDRCQRNAQRLTGIRVVEFGPYVALPLTGRILGSLGAEVIKVETNKVLDEMAFIPAWSRGAGQPEYQRGKRRITLDVRTDAGRDLILEMVRISDVFMTNFRRNVLDRWGIDFPEIRRQRPDSIIMWQTGLGGHGPYYTYKSFGILVQHLSGVSLMTGLPGDPPGVVNTSYSDYHTGVFQPAGIIAALMRRNLTGKTATLESSIFKSGVATCGPALLDYQVNNRPPERRGNRDAWAAPHGVYPCAPDSVSGDADRYIAISIADDDPVASLPQSHGQPGLGIRT